jgi:hypothetical protein
MKRFMRTITTLFFPVIFFSCHKEDPQPDTPTGTLTIQMNYSVDGDPLLFDTLLYVDDVAGYAYRVSDVEYYLSDLRLIKEDSSEVSIRNYQFIRATLPSTNRFSVSSIAPGNYIGVALHIGLTPALNVYGNLADNANNRSMQWPVQYGNGYYFFRFSGQYGNPGDSAFTSFEMALGDNANLVSYRFFHAVVINESTTTLNFDMNLNEWLKHPYDYDFNTYGPYSAGNPVAMGLLKVNGADALSLQ